MHHDRCADVSTEQWFERLEMITLCVFGYKFIKEKTKGFLGYILCLIQVGRSRLRTIETDSHVHTSPNEPGTDLSGVTGSRSKLPERVKDRG